MAIDIQPILDEVNGLVEAETANISNAVFQEYIQNSDFVAQHDILTGIEGGTLVPIIDAEPDYGFLKTNQTGSSCSFNECDYSATSSAKKWEPADYNCEIAICKQDLERDFRKFWNIRCKDFSGETDAFIQFLVELLGRNQNASLWRIGYFDYLDNTNADFAGIDGFFPQWMALAPVGDDQRVEIPENAGATFEDQMALAPDRGYQVYKEMYDKMVMQAPWMINKANLAIETTPELAFNYLNWLQENKEVTCCFNTNNDGVTSSAYSLDNLNYLGVPIIVRWEWQRIIRYFAQASGTVAYDNPHRAVLTYRANKPVGTCELEYLKKFEMFYEKQRGDRTLYLRTESSLDAKVVLDEDFILAI